MIGVILWTDLTDRKAVIWCEDQGDLAFVGSGDAALDAEEFFEVGDVVRFDMTVHRNLRLAKNARRLERNWGSSLRDRLDDVADTPETVVTTGGAEIIPFRPGKRAAVAEKRGRDRQGLASLP